MLGRLNGRFRVGLLSNFTHPPAARRILENTGLEPFFRPILISGELGYRKPHRIVFERLVEGLGVERDEIIYIGDDPEPDVGGAIESGIEPVLSTYVKDHGLSFAPGLMSRSEDETDCLTISQWAELFDLLGL